MHTKSTAKIIFFLSFLRVGQKVTKKLSKSSQNRSKMSSKIDKKERKKRSWKKHDFYKPVMNWNGKRVNIGNASKNWHEFHWAKGNRKEPGYNQKRYQMVSILRAFWPLFESFLVIFHANHKNTKKGAKKRAVWAPFWELLGSKIDEKNYKNSRCKKVRFWAGLLVDFGDLKAWISLKTIGFYRLSWGWVFFWKLCKKLIFKLKKISK